MQMVFLKFLCVILFVRVRLYLLHLIGIQYKLIESIKILLVLLFFIILAQLLENFRFMLETETNEMHWASSFYN